jgi:hypothetical protein
MTGNDRRNFGLQRRRAIEGLQYIILLRERFA